MAAQIIIKNPIIYVLKRFIKVYNNSNPAPFPAYRIITLFILICHFYFFIKFCAKSIHNIVLLPITSTVAIVSTNATADGTRKRPYRKQYFSLQNLVSGLQPLE